MLAVILCGVAGFIGGLVLSRWWERRRRRGWNESTIAGAKAMLDDILKPQDVTGDQAEWTSQAVIQKPNQKCV